MAYNLGLMDEALDFSTKVEMVDDPNVLANGEQPATNVSFSIAYHPTNSDLIFGPFSDDDEGSSMQ